MVACGNNNMTWNCLNGACLDPGDGSGFFLYYSDCLNFCSNGGSGDGSGGGSGSGSGSGSASGSASFIGNVKNPKIF